MLIKTSRNKYKGTSAEDIDATNTNTTANATIVVTGNNDSATKTNGRGKIFST